MRARVAARTIAPVRLRAIFFRALLKFSAALTACARPPSPAPDLRAAIVDAPAGTDVGAYTIAVRLNAARRVITGTERVVWRNTSSRPAEALWWHLYMNAFDGPDTLFMRSGGLAGHRGHAPGDRGRIDVTGMRLASGEDLLGRSGDDPAVPRDRTQLFTTLPRPVAPGESVTIDVSFRTSLPAAFARTGYFEDFVFAAQWFPKLAVLEHDGTWAHFPFHSNAEFYADFARYDLTVTVPHGDIVGACGIEVGTPRTGPDGDTHHFVAEHVHDVSWTAWSQFRERWETLDGVAVRTLAPPGLEGVVRRTLDALGRAFPAFRTRYGRYPYPQLTLVIPPRGAGGVGGMEYPTLITTEGLWFTPSSVHDVEWVAIHEFAHQYFYGLFASNESAHPFLDEGLADYASGRVLTDWFGAGHELFAGVGVGLGYEAFEGGMAGGIHDGLAATLGSADFPSYLSYGDHVYRRTAAAFQSAERLFGRDVVDRGLAAYAARARFAHPTPDVLFHALAETDARLGEFVRQALDGPARLDDAVVSVASVPHDGAFVTTVRLRHSGALAPARRLRVDFADGSHQETPTLAGMTSVTFTSPSPAFAARIDPVAALPSDQNRLDDARLAQGAHARGDGGLTARLAFVLEALLRVVGP